MNRVRLNESQLRYLVREMLNEVNFIKEPNEDEFDNLVWSDDWNSKQNEIRNMYTSVKAYVEKNPNDLGWKRNKQHMERTAKDKNFKLEEEFAGQGGIRMKKTASERGGY